MKRPPLPPQLINDASWNLRRCIFVQEVQRLLAESTNTHSFLDSLPGPNTWQQLQALRIKLELEPYSPEDMQQIIGIDIGMD
jgi:hypothetical protein